MELFWASGSPYAWRVLLALEVKQAPYVSRRIEFSNNEHKTPAYLALNPRGKVPTLKDGDFALTESLAIIAYLDRKFRAPPLLGNSAVEVAHIWRTLSESANYLEPAAHRVIAPIYFGRIDGNEEAIRAAAREVHAELAALERVAAANGWIAIDAVSAADIAVYPFVESLLRAAGKDAARALALDLLPLERNYPALSAWRAGMRALPGHERTWPPHWL